MIGRRLAGPVSAGAVLALTVSGAAQEVAMFGLGPDRVCNVLVDGSHEPVLRKGAAGSVLTAHTYDCPGGPFAPLAQIAPAAGAPVGPLPASGVIYFELDRANLSPEGAASLAAVIEDIKGRRLGGITVAGHTDSSGAAEYNLQLSQRRANTVATELIKAGVPAQLISAQGRGQTDLAVPTADGVEHAANRRVVIDFAP
ncbi:MAG TPA: OmpA family protein [Geminicoccaceae bacterium]|nr:OmpA family protein [Geminicoccaceae bacterium]